MDRIFGKLSSRIAELTGTSWAFILAFTIVLVWAVTGPLFGFSDTWQLVINTGTTIVTFLMVFLIQNTQNRDSKAVQLKLDELLRAVKGARERKFVDLEEKDAAELNEIKQTMLEECSVCTSPEEHRKHHQHAQAGQRNGSELGQRA